MSKILWGMIGVETEVNGLNEVEYKLECNYSTRDALYMLYVLASMIVPSIVGAIALNDGGIIPGIGAMLTLIATIALIPVLSPIIEGYYSAYRVLWWTLMPDGFRWRRGRRMIEFVWEAFAAL